MVLLVAAHHLEEVVVLSRCQDDLYVDGAISLLVIEVLLECLEKLLACAARLAHKSLNVRLQSLLVLVIDCSVPIAKRQ